MQESFDLKNIIKNERFVETAVLVLFISLFIFLKLAQPWNYQISHPYPAFYNANDNFINGYILPQYIKEEGNFRYEPPHTVGGYQSVVGYYPPLLLHLSAMFSTISGIETYDATYFIVALFSISASLLLYFVIRRQSKEIALMSLPFMIGIFNFDFEIARAFGLWVYLTGALFLAAFIWSCDLLKEKYSFLLIALFLSGAALGHMSEAIFSAGFLAGFILLKYAKEKELDRTFAKNAAIGFAAFIAISSYYLIIFKYTWMVGMPYKFEVMSAPPFAPRFGVSIWDFGITALAIIAGIIIGLKKMAFRKKEEFPFTAVAAGLFVLIVGYGNYFGIGVRAWQTRISWPIYFAIFCGIALYGLAKTTFKSLNLRHAALIGIILLLSFSYLHSEGLRGNGIVDQSGWNTLMWIKGNVPENAKVIYFNGMLQSQSFSLWSPKKVSYVVDASDYIGSAEKGIVKSNYSSNAYVDDSAKIPYQESLFKYKYVIFESAANKSIKYDMEYYVLPIGAFSSGGNQGIAQYNLAIRSEMLKQPQAKEAYNNGEYSIIMKTVNK